MTTFRSFGAIAGNVGASVFASALLMGLLSLIPPIANWSWYVPLFVGVCLAAASRALRIRVEVGSGDVRVVNYWNSVARGVARAIGHGLVNAGRFPMRFPLIGGTEEMWRNFNSHWNGLELVH